MAAQNDSASLGEKLERIFGRYDSTRNVLIKPRIDRQPCSFDDYFRFQHPFVGVECCPMLPTSPTPKISPLITTQSNKISPPTTTIPKVSPPLLTKTQNNVYSSTSTPKTSPAATLKSKNSPATTATLKNSPGMTSAIQNSQATNATSKKSTPTPRTPPKRITKKTVEKLKSIVKVSPPKISVASIMTSVDDSYKQCSLFLFKKVKMLVEYPLVTPVKDQNLAFSLKVDQKSVALKFDSSLQEEKNVAVAVEIDKVVTKEDQIDCALVEVESVEMEVEKETVEVKDEEKTVEICVDVDQISVDQSFGFPLKEKSIEIGGCSLNEEEPNVHQVVSTWSSEDDMPVFDLDNWMMDTASTTSSENVLETASTSTYDTEDSDFGTCEKLPPGSCSSGQMITPKIENSFALFTPGSKVKEEKPKRIKNDEAGNDSSSCKQVKLAKICNKILLSLAPKRPLPFGKQIKDREIFLKKSVDLRKFALKFKKQSSRQALVLMEASIYILLHAHLETKFGGNPYKYLKQAFRTLDKVCKGYYWTDCVSREDLMIKSIVNKIHVLSCYMQAVVSYQAFVTHLTQIDRNYAILDAYYKNVTRVDETSATVIEGKSSLENLMKRYNVVVHPSTLPSVLPESFVYTPKSIDYLCQQQLRLVRGLFLAHKFWEKAETSRTQFDSDFFLHLDKICGRLSLTRNVPTCSAYFLTAFEWIRNYVEKSREVWT